ncbi:cysteine proteinase [Ascodesmis nigricans]|uniref:Cysteine proteinase n=1 Tax=Ascodesmis nigricans TaxID=341454 RepID=A0A4S2MIK3_9PEZI|nr:cysteine proteinase [Ascodesmis nigricans]
MSLRNAIRESMSRYREKSEDEEYLTCLIDHDVKVTYEDMRCLRESDGWLNDNNILFWETYLEQNILRDHPGNTVKLLPPSMVQLLKLSPDPAIIKESFGIPPTTSHIFLPVNDTRLTNANAGSHWSLLVVGISDRVALHYDSMSPSNVNEARLVLTQLQALLGFGINFRNLEDTPQQEKTNECGVHVCWAMEFLLQRRLLTTMRENEVDMSLAGKRLDQTRFRRQMVLICEAIKKESKSRSKHSTPSSSTTTSPRSSRASLKPHSPRSPQPPPRSPHSPRSSGESRRHHHHHQKQQRRHHPRSPHYGYGQREREREGRRAGGGVNEYANENGNGNGIGQEMRYAASERERGRGGGWYYE